MKCFVPAVVQRCAMHVKKLVMAGGSLGKAVQPTKLQARSHAVGREVNK